MKKQTTDILQQVLSGSSVPKEKEHSILLSATAELLLHKGVTRKALKTWGTFLQQYLAPNK